MDNSEYTRIWVLSSKLPRRNMDSINNTVDWESYSKQFNIIDLSVKCKRPITCLPFRRNFTSIVTVKITVISLKIFWYMLCHNTSSSIKENHSCTMYTILCILVFLILDLTTDYKRIQRSEIWYLILLHVYILQTVPMFTLTDKLSGTQLNL